jgi:hypothetical protein
LNEASHADVNAIGSSSKTFACRFASTTLLAEDQAPLPFSGAQLYELKQYAMD